MQSHSGTPFDLPKANNFLQNYIIEMSASRLTKHCQTLKFKSDSISAYEKSVILGDEISMILLWGEIGSVVLKSHYKMDVAQDICANALGIQRENVNVEMVRAYMNEYNNLMGGFFRGVLESAKVIVGMSLPFTTKGADEECFFKIRDPRYTFTKWDVKSDKGHIISCTSEILILNPRLILDNENIMNTALENDKQNNDIGNVEFF